ncbi:hypothetical protein CC1G_07267 [Coprinopsis cinerea okayama7|uniref:Uncharacterized protein n=1 Tax=Coprinopsis cinerea (strain Okayama-7 / 130 / ATCC MYA-4618 / FGSC 9003) TaxID=240176 RepID=A8PD56_COPC7|nr:hypothetical protein CC1G_07267 [Coprinopsis cinerea okayama7\|eukprot:XP_001840537.1 hypothetical protein CC1G_07267 [Coprinopsis cinerea okayama7\
MPDPVVLYTRYYEECLEGFPASIEFIDQLSAVNLPVEPLRLPGLPTIPVPIYLAGFFVDWRLRPSEGVKAYMISEQVIDRWEEKGYPKPFISPSTIDWPTGNYLIHFATYASGCSHRDLKYFHEHRDAVINQFLDLTDFTDEAKRFVKTKAFKWHRYLLPGGWEEV